MCEYRGDEKLWQTLHLVRSFPDPDTKLQLHTHVGGKEVACLHPEIKVILPLCCTATNSASHNVFGEL